MTRRFLIEPQSRPELIELLEKARSLPPMTPEQIAAQRKSWVIGEMMLEHPAMLRQEAERLYHEAVVRMGHIDA